MINLSDKNRFSCRFLTALSKGLSLSLQPIMMNSTPIWRYFLTNVSTKDERIALLDLRNVKTIIVKPADKGGSIVVMNLLTVK